MNGDARSGVAGVNAPTVAEVRRIAQMSNVVLRNLEITHAYAQLAAAVASRTGTCANWCTFATWASRQAGCTIRGEDLGDSLRRRLSHRAEWLHPIRSFWRVLLRKGLFEPDTRLGRLVRGIHTPFDALERSSEAVARGNLKVFAEIGEAFARYVAECPHDAPPESPRFQRFASTLRGGEPPDGQRHLRQAFSRYQQQRFEPHANTRAALIALANLEIGLHEQTRLQPEISEALDAPLVTVRDLRTRVWNSMAPVAGRWRVLLRGPGLWLLVRLARAYQRASTRLARQIITEHLMVLSLPGGAALRLGRDLGADVPECLRKVELPDLQAFLDRFHVSAATDWDSGAEDWSALQDRMRYIGYLFRAYHERGELWSAPFTPVQVEQFRHGIVPEGDL